MMQGGRSKGRAQLKPLSSTRAGWLQLRLQEREDELATQRRQEGKKVLGWRKVVAQHFLALPARPEAMFGRTPSFSASSKWARIAAAQVRDDFMKAYRKALKAFRNGKRQVLFPEGTWLMKVRFRVRTKATAVP